MQWTPYFNSVELQRSFLLRVGGRKVRKKSWVKKAELEQRFGHERKKSNRKQRRHSDSFVSNNLQFFLGLSLAL